VPSDSQAQSWSFRHPRHHSISPHNLRQTDLLRLSSPLFLSSTCASSTFPYSPALDRLSSILPASTYLLPPPPPTGQPFSSVPLQLPERKRLVVATPVRRHYLRVLRHVLCGPPAGHCGGIQVIKIAAFQLTTHESRRSRTAVAVVARCVPLCHLPCRFPP